MKSIPRCGWVNLKNPTYVRYHDEEWGVPVHDDTKHMEFLILESAQAGLSWETVLNKREHYRKAFHQFNPYQIGRMSEQDVERMLTNPGLIRNRLKLRAAIQNAKVFVSIQKEFGSFDAFIWSFTDGKVLDHHPKTLSDLKASSALSDAVSKALKKRGMSFVGTTIIHAHLQAIGVINDHLEGCIKRAK